MEGSGQVLHLEEHRSGVGYVSGGESELSGTMFARVGGIVPENVVSALSGVNDQLMRIARFACTGDHVSWQHKLEALKRKHIKAPDKLFQPGITLAVLRQELAAFRQQPTVTAPASEVSAPVYSSYEAVMSRYTAPCK